MLGLLAGSFLPAFASAAPDAAPLTKVVDTAFAPLRTTHDVPGLVVGVTEGGRQHFFTYGTTARDGGKPVTRDTLFEIGSLSKTFTATLATHAQALGRLSLADPVERHVPDLQGSALGRVPLLHFGTYTAGGLPLQFPDEVTTAGVHAYYRAFTPAAAPGVQRRYSNPSIGLLGHATARALQRDFTEASESILFPALGLKNTFIRVPPQAMDSYAWGHDKENSRIRVNPGVFDAEAYGVKSTAVDLLRFVQANLRPATLAPALRTAVEQTHVGHFRAGELVQGLGWEQYPWPVALDRLVQGNSATMALEPHAVQALGGTAPRGPTLFNKTGSTGGFGAYAAFVPERNIGIVMLANRNVPNAARVTAAHAVLAWLSA